mgnify:FL=1
MIDEIQELLGDEARDLLEYEAKVSKDLLHIPGPDFIDRVFVQSDRKANVLKNLQSLFNHGRLGDRKSVV